ncbi:MAG: hypothetical protein DRP01_01435 [Archaeoglobales archaeon]|nr:MAG: hypothetical protein DRP01_01435 [Archaeoglobales archaeon]
MKVYEIILYREGEHVVISLKCPRCGRYMYLYYWYIAVCPSCSYLSDVRKYLLGIEFSQSFLTYFLEDVIRGYYGVIRRLVRDSKERASSKENNNIQKGGDTI